MLQSSTLAMTADVDGLPVEEMRASDNELEILWMKVFQSIYEARKLYTAYEEERQSSRRATSLTLSTFVEGNFSREFSQRVKRAALSLD